jgi:hypothetical protein
VTPAERQRAARQGAEAKRLARLIALAREHRKAERALERAILAASARGIGSRKIAAATGWDNMTVHRFIRSRDGQENQTLTRRGQPGRGAKPNPAGRKEGT